MGLQSVVVFLKIALHGASFSSILVDFRPHFFGGGVLFLPHRKIGKGERKKKKNWSCWYHFKLAQSLLHFAHCLTWWSFFHYFYCAILNFLSNLLRFGAFQPLCCSLLARHGVGNPCCNCVGDVFLKFSCAKPSSPQWTEHPQKKACSAFCECPSHFSRSFIPSLHFPQLLNEKMCQRAALLSAWPHRVARPW